MSLILEDVLKNINKILKKLLIVFLSLLIFVSGAFYVYTLDYYRAEPIAVEALADNQNLNIEKSNDMIVFKPKYGGSDMGFVFYPGGKVEYLSYVPLMQKIANKGYTCVLLKMPLNLAVFDINGADRAIENLPDVKSWYVGGHSLGGAMSSAYAEKNLDKLSGVIFLGAYPSSDLSKTELTMLSIYGSEDKILNRESFENNKKNAPLNAQYYEIQGGNHANYGNYGMQDKDGIATITAEKQQEITANTIVDFLEKEN